MTPRDSSAWTEALKYTRRPAWVVLVIAGVTVYLAVPFLWCLYSASSGEPVKYTFGPRMTTIPIAPWKESSLQALPFSEQWWWMAGVTGSLFLLGAVTVIGEYRHGLKVHRLNVARQVDIALKQPHLRRSTLG